MTFIHTIANTFFPREKQSDNKAHSWKANTCDYTKLIDESDNFFNSVYYQLLVKTLLQLVKNYSDKRESVLDFGCGEGYLTREIAGLNRVISGCDISEYLLNVARNKSSHINYWKENFEKVNQHHRKKFDLVISNLVIMYIKNLSNYLANLSDYLAKKKTAIITLSHPCFYQNQNKNWFNSTKITPFTIGDYFTESSYEKDISGQFRVLHYHRTLETYLKYFRQYNMQIIEIREPKIVKPNNILLGKAAKIPFFLIFVLKKL